MQANSIETSDKILLNLLKEALRNRTFSIDSFGYKDDGDIISEFGYDTLSIDSWRIVFEMAERHLILPMVFEVVFHSDSYEKLEAAHRNLFEKVKKKAAEEVALQYRNTAAFLDLYEYLEKEGIKPLVVKGIVCRSLYPLPEYRQSWDEDIIVSPDDFEACHNALLKYGMTLETDKNALNTAHEVIYRDHSSCLLVEMHRSLFESDSPVFGNWNVLFSNIFTNACHVEVKDASSLDSIWTLNPQQHLFYLICHAFKHFLYFGAGLRQITDILTFSANYCQMINWEELRHCCCAIRAERFVAALFSIGQEYLGFSAGEIGIPETWFVLADDTVDLLSDFLEAGMQGNTSLNRVHSSRIILDAVETDQTENHGNPNVAGILKSLFPSLSSLRSRYPYLTTFPYLLPLAWGQRIVQYAFETRKQGDFSSSGEVIRIGNERIELLRSLDVIGKLQDYSERSSNREKKVLVTERERNIRIDRNLQTTKQSIKHLSQSSEEKNISSLIKTFGRTFFGGRMASFASEIWKILFRIQWCSLDMLWKMHGCKMPGAKERRAVRENVTFIYKSFERQYMAVELYNNIQQFYPGVQVIIADDSREPLSYEAPFLKIIHLPFNSGLGLGISMALDQVETPYIMRMDDDELLTRKTHLGNQLIFLRNHPEVDIVSFGFITVAHHNPEKSVWPEYYKQSMNSTPRSLLIRHMSKLDETHRVLGKGPNIYLARRDSIRKVGYDKNIRMIDHHDFFVRAAGELVTVGALDSFVFHRHDPFDQEYQKYRNDIQTDTEYLNMKYHIHV